MGDIMRPMSLSHLIKWILNEYRKEHSIFGIRKIVRYHNSEKRISAPNPFNDTFLPSLEIFGENLEAPLGPAAGPHTQLAQNIVSAYVAGARYFELKTVQVMDGEAMRTCVTKPCILAQEEGYNCEWSTELTVEQAYEEYAKAWILCKILAKELGLGDPDAFIFHMSVGYDLDGIKSKKIDAFLNQMMDSKHVPFFQDCIGWLLEHIDLFENVDSHYIEKIPSKISSSVSLSTLHGCPANEIEKIATYLIKEKGLHTYIKCNPTLLSYDFVRKTLDQMGYTNLVTDKKHFQEDLSWQDAVSMFGRLIPLAKKENVLLGVKLSNTLPVVNLPADEVYLSGKALLPLTLHLCGMFLDEFEGMLAISYSGGADARTFSSLLQADIWPITMATNLLKPGGYERLEQISQIWKEYHNTCLDSPNWQKCQDTCSDSLNWKTRMAIINDLEKTIHNHPSYQKSRLDQKDKPIAKPLPIFDCFASPCRFGCPIGQDIPAYLAALEEGRVPEAFQIILEQNPLPFLTGSLCHHPCQNSCMRNYYDQAVSIRNQKLQIAKEAYGAWIKEHPCNKPPLPNNQKEANPKKIAIVGGGPAGLSAAAFLSRLGLPVTVFEKRNHLGGIPYYTIPDFRISLEAIDRDISICKSYGAKFILNTEITDINILINDGYTDIILATGAWHPGNARLQYGEAVDALEFLEQAKFCPDSLEIGKHLVVIGDGNTAVDVARLALKMDGVEKVSMVSLVEKDAIPADPEELQLAINEGLEILECHSAIGYQKGQLTCQIIGLSARSSTDDTMSKNTSFPREYSLPADYVVAAVGQKVDNSLCGNVSDDLTLSNKIHIIGDARKGPASIVEAIADAQKVASAIANIDFNTDININANFHTCNNFNAKAYFNIETNLHNHSSANSHVLPDRYLTRRGRMIEDPKASTPCLGCSTLCNTCLEVCPNRANISIQVPGTCQPQILHMDGMCNECGNCQSFCPYEGHPAKDKFTLFWTEEDFHSSQNDGFFILNDRIFTRIGQKEQETSQKDLREIPKSFREIIETVLTQYSYLLNK